MHHLKRRLRKELKDLYQVNVSEKHLNQTSLLAQRIYRDTRKMNPISFSNFMYRQIKHVGLPIWIFQAVVLFLTLLLFGILFQEPIYTDNPILLSMLSIFTAMTSIPFLGRSIKYKMFEIEMVTSMSLGKLTLCRLLIIGIGDAAALFILMGLSVSQLNIAITNLLIYIIMPFLLTCYGCMFIFNRMGGMNNISLSTLFCFLLMILIQKVYIQIPLMPANLIVGVCSIVSIISMILLVVESYKLIKRGYSLEYTLTQMN